MCRHVLQDIVTGATSTPLAVIVCINHCLRCSFYQIIIQRNQLLPHLNAQIARYTSEISAGSGVQLACKSSHVYLHSRSFDRPQHWHNIGRFREGCVGLHPGSENFEKKNTCVCETLCPRQQQSPKKLVLAHR